MNHFHYYTNDVMRGSDDDLIKVIMMVMTHKECVRKADFEDEFE